MSSGRVKKRSISGYVPQSVFDEIEVRASRIKRTRNEFVSEILNDWYDRGAPYIDEIDKVMSEKAREAAS